MENKELQELFTAARTTEANRRRQERLTAMIEAQTPTKKNRRLWPIWAASVAAGIAVLLMTMPTLFRPEHTEQHVLVAKETGRIGDSSITVLTGSPEIAPLPAPTRKTDPIKGTTPTRETISTIPTAPLPSSVLAEDETETPALLSEPMVEPQPEPIQQQPQRRVHRRTSTRMVTCDKSPRFDYHKAIADALCKEDNKPLTLHTIKIS